MKIFFILNNLFFNFNGFSRFEINFTRFDSYFDIDFKKMLINFINILIILIFKDFIEI